MNKNRRRWLLRLSILPLAGIAFLLWWSYHERTRSVTVENRSGKGIAQLQVTAAGQTSTYAQLHDGGAVTAPCGGDGDHFDVEGRFDDGAVFKGQGQFPESSPGQGTALVIGPGGGVAPRKSSR
jgi:hypothetical protein